MDWFSDNNNDDDNVSELKLKWELESRHRLRRFLSAIGRVTALLSSLADLRSCRRPASQKLT